jgi:polar amino acid transport system substrate-binding protein
MRLLCALALFVASLLTPGGAQAATIWRLGTIELPPSISEKAPLQGYYAVLLRRVLRELDAEAQFVFLPPQRAHVEALSGQLDGVFPYKRTAQRERDFWFSDAFFMASVRVFLRAGDGWDPGSIEDLRSQTGCTLQGAQAPAALQAEVDAERVPLQRVTQIEACFRMLQLGRVRFVIAGQNTGWAVAKTLPGPKLRMAHFVVAEEPVHLALSRRVAGNADRLKAFNQALRKLKGQGVMQQLEAQHVPAPPPLE